MPRRSRVNWPLCIGVSIFLLILAGYIAWPLRGVQDAAGPLAMEPFEQLRQRGTTVVVTLWFFVLGASIGSFLNVVAYRLPLGLTIVSAPSRCPYCLRGISLRHNVPILGWLILRGRCRACRLPISPRYILVELLVGGIFICLFFAELASGGRSIPLRQPNRLAGVMWNVITPQLDLIGLYAFHACLLSVLVVCALLGIDRLRIPKRLIVFSCVIGIGAPLIWPQLSVVPWSTQTADWLPYAAWARFMTPIAGLLFGSTLGLIVETTLAAKHGNARYLTGDIAQTLAIVGVFLGWQAVILSLLLTTMIHTLSAGWRRGGTLWAMWILLGTTLMLCTWRAISSVRFLPGATSSIVVHGYWIVALLVMLFITYEFGPRRRS